MQPHPAFEQQLRAWKSLEGSTRGVQFLEHGSRKSSVEGVNIIERAFSYTLIVRFLAF